MLFFALASVYYFYRLFGVNTARSRTLLRAASASSSLEAVGIQWYQRSHHLLPKKGGELAASQGCTMGFSLKRANVKRSKMSMTGGGMGCLILSGVCWK